MSDAGGAGDPDVDPSCLFCRIVAGEIPSRQVYADDVSVAFLDVAPWQRGHTLVVPRRHVADLLTDPPMLGVLGPAVDAVSRLLVDRLHADGLNLLSNAKSVSGQEVFHLHLHLIPRYAARPGLANLRDPDGGAGEDLDGLHALITG